MKRATRADATPLIENAKPLRAPSAFQIVTVAEPSQPPGIGRLRVLQRTDQKFIVYDPAMALGQRTVSVHPDLEAATRAALRIAREEGLA